MRPSVEIRVAVSLNLLALPGISSSGG
jgi:hypothetical protein